MKKLIVRAAILQPGLLGATLRAVPSCPSRRRNQEAFEEK
jgi:hypothetical protein